ncbi:hypothetical protein H6769_03755 [Candidatus Peribacteria bacterium]|nr:hypothetical protein [Candidatus Peribacteria bacterium]
MFRLDMSECGKRVFIIHTKTGRIVHHPTVMAVKPNYGGAVLVPFGEDACRQFFQKMTNLIVVNGRGVPAEDFFSQKLLAIT